MSQSTINGDLLVNGNINCEAINPLAASIGNAAIVSPPAPGQAIDTPKLRHRTVHGGHFNADGTTTAAAVRKVAHVVKGTAGSIVGFDVGAVTAPTVDATVTIQLLKNGTNVLSGTFQLTASTAAYALAAAPGFTSTVLAAGDVLEVRISAVSAGSGVLPAGVFFRLIVDEDPS